MESNSGSDLERGGSPPLFGSKFGLRWLATAFAGLTRPSSKAAASRRTPNLSAACACLILLAGCARSTSSDASTSPATATAAPRYPLTGEVLSVDAAKKLARVRHDAVKGFMPAMTMDFAVSTADAAAMKPGQRIHAELVPSTDSDFRLEKIWPADQAGADTI